MVSCGPLGERRQQRRYFLTATGQLVVDGHWRARIDGAGQVAVAFERAKVFGENPLRDVANGPLECAEGDLVVLHNTYDNAVAFGAETLVAFDVFRVEDGRVAEHWDTLQPLVTETASGRSMTDGPTDIADLDKTAENKGLVEGFIADILHGGAPGKVTDYISTETYVQHNPMVADGLDGLGAALAAMAEAGQAMRYDATHLVVAEGNFVFAAFEGTIGDAATAFFDLFRVEDGRIVEHWDTVSEIPAQMAHDNGKF